MRFMTELRDLGYIENTEKIHRFLAGFGRCPCADCIESRKKDANLIKDLIGKGEDMQDTINHPEHYKSACGLEAIDVIEAFNLNFNLGNAIKYILRAGRKDDELEDLKKAVWYLRREVRNIEEEEEEDE